jgi:hypothetical protein
LRMQSMNVTYTGPSDQTNQVQLQSHLIYSLWLCKAAYAGSGALLEIRTSFVGDGASVKITGKTEQGSNLGRINSQIYGNKLTIDFPIPTAAQPNELAYVEVDLPQHGLHGESNRIPTRKPIIAQRMQWSAPEAHRGDILTLTAQFQPGIPNDTDALVIICEYDQNGNHDPIAKIPTTVQNSRIQLDWEYDYHEDTDEIPTQQEMQRYGGSYAHPEYFFIIEIDEIRVGENQQSGLLRFKDWIDLELHDENDNPIANEPFVVYLPDGTQLNDSLDPQGKKRVRRLAPGPMHVEFPNRPYIDEIEL